MKNVKTVIELISCFEHLPDLIRISWKDGYEGFYFDTTSTIIKEEELKRLRDMYGHWYVLQFYYDDLNDYLRIEC